MEGKANLTDAPRFAGILRISDNHKIIRCFNRVEESCSRKVWQSKSLRRLPVRKIQLSLFYEEVLY